MMQFILNTILNFHAKWQSGKEMKVSIKSIGLKISLTFLFFTTLSNAQQTGQYTQYLFNKYGYNPAAAGTNINNKFEAIVGYRTQWTGLDNSPKSNFFSFNYTFKPPRSYRLWHNAGIYLAQEKSGIFQNFGIYGSYTIHLLVSKRMILSFGIFAGAKRFSLNKTLLDSNDPAVSKSTSYFYGYPDFYPGIRLYNKKIFFDVSVQQLYKNRQVQGAKQIGDKSFLTPQLYVSTGKVFKYGTTYRIVPSFNIHTSFTNKPSVEAGIMFYYKTRLGLGTSLRGANFISGIVQVRMLNNLTLGVAYDYSINKLNVAAPHTLEIMLGITPIMSGLETQKNKHNVAKCPALDF